MNKMWNVIKEKRFDERIKKLEKQALHYIQENENLEQHIADLQGSNTVEIMEITKKNDDGDKKTQKGTKPEEKPNNKKISQKQSKSDIVFKHDSESETKESYDNGIDSIILKHKRTRKGSRKRCHFCRKRGHVQKDCLSKQVLRRWLRDEAREMYKNTMQ